MADYTPFPLNPWYERPNVLTPVRSHKVMAAGPNGSGGVASEMLSVDQILGLLTASDINKFADPLTKREAKNANYAATVNDSGKTFAFTVGGKTLTLPLAASALATADGYKIRVSAEVGTLNIVRSGTTDTILGASSITLAQGETADIFLNAAGDGWRAAIAPPYSTVARTDVSNNFAQRQHLAKGTTIASAASIALPINGNFFDVSGTATIASISTMTQAGTRIQLRATGAWTLQHNAASMILPRSANLPMSDGDIIEMVSLGGGNYVLTSISKADGTSLVASADVKAWANLNLSGTPVIRAAKNVSSITKNASGDWTANFTTALVDANHAPVLSAPPANGRQPFLYDGAFNSGGASFTPSGFRFAYGSMSSGALLDISYLTFIVAR